MSLLPGIGPADGRSAILSPCGRYRYRLSRTWDASKGRAVFVMLNPSTADADQDDPTIRRCVGFARSWGYGELAVVNLFAWRATKPRDLLAAPDPIGPDNLSRIREAVRGAGVVVAAWGAFVANLPPKHDAFRNRGIDMIEAVEALGPLHVIGVNRDGNIEPRHPLYLKADEPLVPYGPTVPGGVAWRPVREGGK